MPQNLGSLPPLSQNVTLLRPLTPPLKCDVIYGCPLTGMTKCLIAWTFLSSEIKYTREELLNKIEDDGHYRNKSN